LEKSKQKGKRRTVWLPYKLDKKAEEVRKSLGLGLSAFYRFAIVEVVKQFQTQKFKLKEKRRND
jgi:hypothetical protein